MTSRARDLARQIFLRYIILTHPIVKSENKVPMVERNEKMVSHWIQWPNRHPIGSYATVTSQGDFDPVFSIVRDDHLHSDATVCYFDPNGRIDNGWRRFCMTLSIPIDHNANFGRPL